MIPVTFSKKDILRSTLVEPAWYRLICDAVTQEPKLTQGKAPSMEYHLECSIVFNGDNGDSKFAGVPITIYHYSNGIGFMVGLFEALGQEITEGSRFDLESVAGKEFDAFVENNNYNGKLSNRVNSNYRKPKADVKAA
jgi:hypothetical protein